MSWWNRDPEETILEALDALNAEGEEALPVEVAGRAGVTTARLSDGWRASGSRAGSSTSAAPSATRGCDPREEL